jgi:hypothetical protein
MGSLLRMVYGNPSMTVITWKLQVQKKYSKSLVSVFVVKKKLHVKDSLLYYQKKKIKITIIY